MSLKFNFLILITCILKSLNFLQCKVKFLQVFLHNLSEIWYFKRKVDFLSRGEKMLSNIFQIQIRSLNKFFQFRSLWVHFHGWPHGFKSPGTFTETIMVNYWRMHGQVQTCMRNNDLLYAQKNSLFAFILYLISLGLNGFVCVSFLGIRIMLKENGMLWSWHSQWNLAMLWIFWCYF